VKRDNINKLDFSIIVCCYFGEKTIVSCLRSLISQKYSKEGYEIIIVDDGSIDNSSDVINAFLKNLPKAKPLIKYFNTPNNGLSKARNFGIDKSEGKYVLFIDEDARACTDWLLEYKTSIINHNPDVLYGLIKPFENANWFEKFITKTFYDKFDKYGNLRPVLIGANMGFKKQVFDGCAGFFDDYSYRGDETVFIMSLEKTHSIIGNINAFVYHENPDHYIKWLKERYQNGEAEYIIDNYIVNYFNFETNTYIIKKVSKKVIFLFVAIFLFSQGVYLFIYLFATIFLIYVFKRKEIISRKIHLKKSGYKHSLLLLIFSIILRTIGYLVKEFGYAKRLVLNESYSPNRGSFSNIILKQVIIRN
jgi:glycosyltransferase involved in cell wall biosynthesis